MKNVLREFLEYQENNPQLTGEALISNFLGYTETIGISTWSKEDIRGQAENMEVELTEEQVNEVAELMVHGFDASIGINWDVIETWIYEVTRGE